MRTPTEPSTTSESPREPDPETPHQPPGRVPASLNALLDAAVARGIIAIEQRAALGALAAEVGPASDDVAGGRPAAPVHGREARRGFNAVTVAYSLGALLVLVALAWFLAARWSELGAWGVLGVSVAYTAVFALVARELRRRGYEVAGGIAATLAVMMTPVWTWAILRLTGEWPGVRPDDPLVRYPPWMNSRWIILELATIGVGLFAIRRVRFFGIAAPIAAALVLVLLHAGEALGNPRYAWYLGPYYQAAVACVLLAVAYAVDRARPRDEDYALWFYIAAVFMLVVAYIQLWSFIGWWRHAVPFAALAFVAAALYLRRRVLLIGGIIGVFGYLGYLAFDVFRNVVDFPLLLAGFGLVVIVGTVWIQRRFPALAERAQLRSADDRPALPGGALAATGPLIIAVWTLLLARPEAHERTLDRETSEEIHRRRGARHGLAPSRPRPREEPGTGAVPVPSRPDTSPRGETMR